MTMGKGVQEVLEDNVLAVPRNCRIPSQGAAADDADGEREEEEEEEEEERRRREEERERLLRRYQCKSEDGNDRDGGDDDGEDDAGDAPALSANRGIEEAGSGWPPLPREPRRRQRDYGFDEVAISSGSRRDAGERTAAARTTTPPKPPPRRPSVSRAR